MLRMLSRILFVKISSRNAGCQPACVRLAAGSPRSDILHPKPGHDQLVLHRIDDRGVFVLFTALPNRQSHTILIKLSRAKAGLRFNKFDFQPNSKIWCYNWCEFIETRADTWRKIFAL